MNNPLSKTPFLFLLIPLVAGIILQYYLNIQYWSIAFFLTGIGGMLFSFLIPDGKQYRLRWLFGAGAFFFIIGIGIISTSFRQSQSDFTFKDESLVYKGFIMDIPQEKPNSVAYNVFLPDANKQIVCYLQSDSLSNALNPGDEILFQSRIQPFRNMGNPDDFDYAGYMYNQGFAGSAYLRSYAWQSTGGQASSLKITALKFRQKILQFYRSLGFDETEFAILSALTLGYKGL